MQIYYVITFFPYFIFHIQKYDGEWVTKWENSDEACQTIVYPLGRLQGARVLQRLLVASHNAGITRSVAWRPTAAEGTLCDRQDSGALHVIPVDEAVSRLPRRNWLLFLWRLSARFPRQQIWKSGDETILAWNQKNKPDENFSIFLTSNFFWLYLFMKTTDL